MDVIKEMQNTIETRGLACTTTPVLLMISGGSDSTALGYLAAELRQQGVLTRLAILHVNHHLREGAAEADAQFVKQLAHKLNIPFFSCDIDVGAIAREEKGNVEAVARRERYNAAHDALTSLCLQEGVPVATGRIFTAHTADDRIESFYMRSIVGTGPGGFRAMKYLNGQVARPLLDVGREDLRTYITKRAASEAPTIRDAQNALWREDATNEHTERFRAYVRNSIVPLAKKRNPQLISVLTRTMNLIGDEDDMLDTYATELMTRSTKWIEQDEAQIADYSSGCTLSAVLAREPHPLRRRVCMKVLGLILGDEARVETASIEAVLDAYSDSTIKSGYVTNIQGNLAVSANKQGVRIEPMSAFRARRKRG